MLRRLSAAFASAVLVAVAAPSFAASPMPAMSSMKTTCPKGTTMVKGYKKADGTMVKAYCRKSSSMSSSMKGGAMMSPAPKATM